jgi:hypothetical protein
VGAAAINALQWLHNSAVLSVTHTAAGAVAAAAACRNAWSQLGQLQQQSAMEQYIATLGQHDPQWLAEVAAATAAGAEGSSKAAAGGKKSGVGGPVFSTLVHSGDHQQQQQQVRVCAATCKSVHNF